VNRHLLEVEQRLIDPRGNVGMGREQIAHTIDITGFDGGDEELHRRFGETVDLVLELRPAGKAVATRDDKLCIAQRKSVGRRRLRVQCRHAGNGFRLAAPEIAGERLGELSLLLQVGIGGERLDEILRVRLAGGCLS